MSDPVEWAAWAYGKFGHWGLGLTLLLVVGIVGLVWWRGVEKYQKEHQTPPPPAETRADTSQEVENALTAVRETGYRKLVADVLHAMEPSAYSVTSILRQCPASASSTLLSTTSCAR